jgi:hypothetical protein
MTRAIYQSMFLSLSALLMAALFVLQPTADQDMQKFQSEIRGHFAQAASELVAGESFAEPFALVWTSVNNFYTISADESVALLEDSTLSDIALMFDADYFSNMAMIQAPRVARVVQEEALLNIVPMSDEASSIDPYFNEDLAYSPDGNGVVAGDSIDASAEVPMEPAQKVTWITLNDSITNFPYCVAVFNGTVNSYPGACARDEIAKVYEN